MRTFIAIELPEEIQDSLSVIQERLKTGTPEIRWVKPQNLHLTLKFLGDITFEQLNGIKEIITEITKISPAFKIKINSAGVFPNMHAARIIWMGSDQLPLGLKQLALQLETRLVQTGIPQEQRPFRAHITIGRVKEHIAPADLGKVLNKIENEIAGANWEFACGKIALFESTLEPKGPTYALLEKFILLT
ncbi:MAG: RNA 2',3'-cyclic phosphodiesterase [Candidatus Omnitrophica bacterium]|nr:RNA 2',3'-cyclic phosphodiesterase [Candidatus Omnitrophota bacterium]